jgi:hypothetical protein
MQAKGEIVLQPVNKTNLLLLLIFLLLHPSTCSTCVQHQGNAFRKSFLVVYLIGIISITAGLVLVILEKIG